MTKKVNFKKCLALLLSLLMVVSASAFSISADTDAITIASEGDWATYVEAGGFPENAKVTVSATLTSLSTSFNGNGAVVTTSVPLFNTIEGATIENFTIEGELNDHAAALAITATNCIIKNVVNNADVTNSTSPNSCVAVSGFVAIFKQTLTFTDCVNNGDITYSDMNANESYAAGFATYSHGIGGSFLYMDNCVNNGNITNKNQGSVSVSGGIIGFAGKWVIPILNNCGNNGDVTSYWLSSGLLPRQWNRPSELTACYNTGTITTTSATPAGTTGIADGIYYADASYVGKIEYCWNSGDIVSNDASTEYQISREVKNTNTILNGNFVCSDVKNGDNMIPAIGGNDAAVATFSAADLASGKLAYDINTVAQKQVFFQNLTENAANPTADAADGTVIKLGDAYYSLRLTTADKASARIADTAEFSGLRFTTTVNADDLAKLPAGTEISYGTRITPDHYLTAEGEFSAMTEGNYVDVMLEGDPFFEGTSFRGSIVSIKADNFDMDYSAIGFAKIGDVTVWSSTYSTRNIKEIADAAYDDRSATQEGDYVNEITNAALAVEGKPYSPYTEAELTILKGYIG